MRFKATLNNPTGLHKLAQTLEKLGPVCFAVFSKTELRFITHQNNPVDIQSWTVMNPSCMFSEYRLQSLQVNNEVYFAFNLANLLLITKDLVDCTRITVGLKDTNGNIILSFKWTSESFKGSKDLLNKELPIQLVTGDKIQHIRDPVTMEAPDTYILLPDVNVLKVTAERFKTLNGFLKLSANMKGEFKVEVQSPFAMCSSHYENLQHPELVGHDLSTREPESFSSVCVKSDDFVHFLNCAYLEPDNIICSITHDRQLTFLIYLRIDTYQNEDAPLRSLNPQQCRITVQLPLYIDN
ncbi:checkpoint protein Hus1/Mec3 [Gilbertella persicaria]|uniref:checkpoint protein Hus1/Mec3 n=1 Tax=Gilbertella persicaria TaxID=101096 RepID=UPI00221F4F49|nr:checkpoint protein Hus1/Mec3 [Gilbertella persicaria]KAI8047187.1 checkpoint protein Hus1/Mec3 [Gilbertella persicaria]